MLWLPLRVNRSRIPGTDPFPMPGVTVYRDVLLCMHHVNMEQPFSVRFPHTVCATKGGEGEADVLGKAHGDPERG